MRPGKRISLRLKGRSKLFTTALTLMQAAIRSGQQKMSSFWNSCQCGPVKEFPFGLKAEARCCYTVRSTEDVQLLELMSMRPGKRISLRLKGRSKIRGTLQLIRDTAGAYSLRVYLPQECEKRKTGTLIGIDLGYTEMMATSEQELLGTDLGQYFSAISDKRRKNSEGRNRMYSLFRNLLKKPNKDNLAKAERLRKLYLCRKKHRGMYIRDSAVP